MDNQLETIPDRSVAKHIQDTEGRFPKELTAEEQIRKDRLLGRMVNAGVNITRSYQYRSRLAEELYAIKAEEDWKIVIKGQNVDEDTGEITVETYERWVDFRVLLAEIYPISVGSISNYLKYVTVYVEGLGKDPSTFSETGGIIAMKHMLEMSAGHDLRVIEDGQLRNMLRPKTEMFKGTLEKEYPGESYPDQLGHYYDDYVAHDYDDPSAINKDPAELGAQAKDKLGAPDIWATVDNRDLRKYIVYMRYPDIEENGTTVLGEQESYTLTFNEPFVPGVVTDWLMDRLNINKFR